MNFFNLCHCLWVRPWAPLRRVQFPLLCSLPSGIIHIENIFPHLKPSVPQTKQCHLSQPFLWQVLRSLNHLLDPLPNLQQYLHICLVLGNPELGTALQLGLASAEQARRITSFWPVNNTFFPNSAQDAVSCLCCKGALLVLGHFGVHQDHRSFSADLLSSWAASSLY